jgi:hypothetical protein
MRDQWWGRGGACWGVSLNKDMILQSSNDRERFSFFESAGPSFTSR